MEAEFSLTTWDHLGQNTLALTIRHTGKSQTERFGHQTRNRGIARTGLILVGGLNCPPFRPDSRHKQKGSSTGLRTCVTPPGSQEESLFDGVEVWCGHVFGFFCGEAPPPASMDYASSIHFRLTCCQHLSSIRFSEPRSNSSAIQSLDLHCCAGIRQAGCM